MAPPRTAVARRAVNAQRLALGLALALLGCIGGGAFSLLRHAARGLGPRGAGDAAPAVVRHAEGEGEEVETQPMSDATVYMTEVDVMTGEVDTSTIPDEMGVYAVFDNEGKLRYIGLSRQVDKSIANHAKAIGVREAAELISEIRFLSMDGQPKEALKATWQRWISEWIEGGGEIPTGNLPDKAQGCDTRWRAAGVTAKPGLNLAGTRGITSMAEAVKAVEKAVADHPVLLFMKGTPAQPACGFSARAVGMLRDIGTEFETVNVMDGEMNPGVREAVKTYSKWPTIPQLFVRGELLGGADIMSEMYESGDLAMQIVNTDSGEAASSKEGAASSESVAEGSVDLVDDARRPVASAMSKMLSDNFQLRGLKIIDESAANEGDAGALAMGITDESHFRVEVVAPEFEGLSQVQRQQKVFDALSDIMPRVHALSLFTKAPTEDGAAVETKGCVEELKSSQGL